MTPATPCLLPLLSLSFALVPALARAAPWEARPEVELPGAAGVAQRVELADIDADGFVDLVFAHSRGDSTGSDADAQLAQLLINDGGTAFVELDGVFAAPDNAYAIKAGDLDGDGDLDLVVGVNFSGQSHALLQEGGSFTRHDIVPGTLASVGDLELGDVDDDGDLDVLAADWGDSQPFGDVGDPGGPLRLWLGAGDGTFTDGAAGLPPGMDALVSWSFDVELADLDNDLDLDALIASRGPGDALVLRNEGAGLFTLHPVPALQGKPINAAFTPIDVDGDDFIDLVTLGDGGDACAFIEGEEICGGRNAVLLGDKMGQLLGAGGFWPEAANPPGRWSDAASLDLDNNGTPDLVVVGPRSGLADPNALVLLNSGAGLTAAGPAFPTLPELDEGFGLMLADLDGDRREDVALAVRDDTVASAVLFGRSDPNEGVPEDISPPSIGQFELVPDLLVAGQTVRLHARVHDRKAPTRMHDFLHDDALDTYNLEDGAATAHRRRLPYVEYARGLADPADLLELEDTQFGKRIVPGVWMGEALWRISFVAPEPLFGKEDTLTWRLCAIDAAGNKACVGPFQAAIEAPESCGDGIVDPWEQCDNPEDPLCFQCEIVTCGDGDCQEPVEGVGNCPQDCAACDDDGFCEPNEEDDLDCCDCVFCEPCGDGVCDPLESWVNCPVDCSGHCGDCVCDMPGEDIYNCPEDCGAEGTSCGCGDGTCVPGEEGHCPEDCPVSPDSATEGTNYDLETGCGCRGAPASGGLLLGLALLGRRRRTRRPGHGCTAAP